MDFGELTIDGSIDTVALSSAIPEAGLNKIRLAIKAIIEESAPPDFHITVANGGIEHPVGTVLLQFEVGDLEFRERFIVMKDLTHSMIGLWSLQRKNTILDVRKAVLNFPFISMHLESTNTPTPGTQDPLIFKSDLHLKANEIITVEIATSGLNEHNNGYCPIRWGIYDDHDTVLVCPALTTLTN